MFRIVVTALFFVNGLPGEKPETVTSLRMFDTREECEGRRPADGSVIRVDQDLAVVKSSACERLPDSPNADDLLADTLRRMVEGGGFGTINN